ncbi:MAG: dephospho-CoA kinase [Patescibacteria group bacterium]
MNARYRKGMVALSADPITFGHLHLIETARDQCDTLVVLIANNDMKANGSLFTLEERTEIARRTTAHMPRVEVMSSNDLLVDIFLAQGCDVLFRGIRNEEDRAYEERQMAYHALIYPPIADQIMYLPSSPAFTHISSTLVKAFANHHVDSSAMVPLLVKQRMEERLHGQFKLGVTGEIATGKSWICHAVCEKARQSGLDAHTINIDELLRSLYLEQTPGTQRLREEIAQHIGDHVLCADRTTLDRHKMAETLFDATTSSDVRIAIEQLVRPHIDRLFRAALQGKHGLILIEWAQLAQMQLGNWTNNHVLLVESEDRPEFARERGINTERLMRMKELQWDADHQADALEQRAMRDGHGSVIRFHNHRDAGRSQKAVEDLLMHLQTNLFPQWSTT